MSVDLQKGQGVELRKDDGGELTQVMVGLGWDEAQEKQYDGRHFSAWDSLLDAIDCDASAFLCTNGKLAGSVDVVYYGNLKHISGSVRHMGDNLTGEGDGDDEEIFVDLKSLPAEYDKIVFVVNIYQASARGQHFGMIKNAFIRICDNGKELCKYNLSEDCSNKTAMIFGALYRNNGTWKFNAIGEATTDDGIEALARRFV